MDFSVPGQQSTRRFAEDVPVALGDAFPEGARKGKIAMEIDALLADPRFAAPGRVVLCGSGDSLFAARSVLPALRRWTGLAIEVKTSLDFARYEAPLLGAGDVLLAISNSGNSTRTRETIALARDRGLATVGITGSLEGPLAELAESVVHRPVGRCDRLDPSYARVFLNMAEYLATLYTLFALGLEWGARRGRLSAKETAAHYAAIDGALASLAPIARASEPAMIGLAEDLADADTVWTIGAGPNFGTAEYCAAKFHEQIPLNGIAQDLEEWAHLQYFLTLSWGKRSVVLVLAPPGNALDRAEELVEGIAGAGGRAIVLAHPDHGTFAGALRRIDLSAEAPELLTPVSYHIPVQLLVLHLAQRAGVPRIPLSRQDDYWLIRKGLIRTSAEDLD